MSGNSATKYTLYQKAKRKCSPNHKNDVNQQITPRIKTFEDVMKNVQSTENLLPGFIYSKDYEPAPAKVKRLSMAFCNKWSLKYGNFEFVKDPVNFAIIPPESKKDDSKGIKVLTISFDKSTAFTGTYDHA